MLNSLSEIKEKIKNQQLSLIEMLDELYRDIENSSLNAYITLMKEYAYKQAEKIEKNIKDKKSYGKLLGVPIAIKDNINIKGVKTTCGSKILSNFVSPFNATVIEKLEKEGAIFIGKTNMDEFAMGSSTETSFFGPTRNPRNPDYVPGGSSGGSAATVANGDVLLALGSDTGGSIRQPSALCGVVGLKPTYGRVSRYGLVAFASSLDQIGPIGRKVEDVALLLQIISGFDSKDSTSVNITVSDYPSILKNKNKFKIGLPKEYFSEGIEKEVEESISDIIEILKKENYKICDISLPHTEMGISVYYIVAPSEASANLARYDGVKYGVRVNSDSLFEMYRATRGEGFGSEVKRRIMLGTYALSSGYYDAYYLKAQKVRTLIKKDFDQAFQKVDIILTPTSPTVAFKIGEKIDAPLKMYLSDIFTIPVNLAGLPAISIPCGKGKNDLPIGVQLIGRPFREEDILQLGYFLEKRISY